LEELKALQPEEYEVMYRTEESHWWYRALRQLQTKAHRRFAPKAPLRILDVGCGTGAFLAMANSWGECTGIDIAPEALACCRRRGQKHLARASALALPFPDEQFDVIALMDVLYHKQVSDKDAPLREIYRLLKPGGIVMLNVPAYQWLFSSHDVAVHTDKRFTRPEIIALLQKNGFHVAFAGYWNTLLFPAVASARLLRKVTPQRGSDLDDATGPLMGGICTTLLSLEQRLMPYLPFGLSVFAVGKRVSPPS
jgi:ubiquinone/menaquinone biosynthesis C-methylase UbiE